MNCVPKRHLLRCLLLLACLLPAASLPAQNLKEFEKSVSEFTIENGMHFIVVERHHAPIVTFDLYVDVGSVDEPSGETGVSHMFEHLAFKGTRSIGTKNYEAEQKALEALDKAYSELSAERVKGETANQTKLHELEKGFQTAQKNADEYVATNEFMRIIERAGGVGLNAQTSADSTRYFLSLPSNKLELWFSMESDRFLQPVIRDFYKERDVVMEERRMRVDSEPTGRMMEDFLSAAYKAHPYHNPTIGWASDIQNLTRPAAQEYFKKHYVASALSACIVGDVDPKEVRRLAETYFGRLPKRPKAEPVHTVEPPQDGERRIQVLGEAQPYMIIGYHRAGVSDPDRNVLDIISDVLGGGRTSWLYTTLVKQKRIAVDAEAIGGLPGMKYPNLFIFAGVPAEGHTADEVEKGIDEQIERIKHERVSEQLLTEVKRRNRAAVLRALRSNSGLASTLNDNYVLLGDWRYLFLDLDLADKVTADDVLKTANQYFVRTNRTVAVLVQPHAPTGPTTAPKTE